jgi:hypothetical protein
MLSARSRSGKVGAMTAILAKRADEKRRQRRR